MYYILHKDNKLVCITLEEPIIELTAIGVSANRFD